MYGIHNREILFDSSIALIIFIHNSIRFFFMFGKYEIAYFSILRMFLSYFLDDFVDYDYYGGLEEMERPVPDESSNKQKNVANTRFFGDELTEEDQRLSGEEMVVKDEKKSSIDFDLYEHLMTEIRGLHSTINDLKASVTKLILQGAKKVNESQMTTGMFDNKSISLMENESMVLDLEFEKVKQLNIDIKKISVNDADFEDFPEFNTTEVDLNVQQLGSIILYDTISNSSDYILRHIKNFGLTVTSDTSTLIWFCLFVFGLLFFVIGIVVLFCKYFCCKTCHSNQTNIKKKDSDSPSIEKRPFSNISEPYECKTTYDDELIPLNEAIGFAFPIPRKLERSASCNAKFDKPKQTFSTFVTPPTPPPSRIPTPPPLPPKKTPPWPEKRKSASCPNTPIVRKRVSYAFDATESKIYDEPRMLKPKPKETHV